MNRENSNLSLFFFFNPVHKEILFSSLPFESFFGSPASLETGPPFINAFHNNDTENLNKEWQSCLQLKENETHYFSFSKTGTDKNLVFDFSVLCAVLSSLNGSPGLLFHVKKSTGSHSLNKTAHNYQKDYAEFIELAGHDLDAPLRKLSILIERLVAKIEPAADVESYITRIQTSLTDMRSMIDNLSMLSALAFPAIKKDRCNIAYIVHAIAEQLPHHRRDMIKVISPLPVLEGDCKQYQQLFKNLLDNAILFGKKETPVIVEIGAGPLQQEERLRFDLPGDTAYVKIIIADNGIGFSQEYAEKIFRPFVRLHGKSEYPGHGMGLAVCKKIVENHHGIIQADGKPGEGARFIVILPQTIS